MTDQLPLLERTADLLALRTAIDSAASGAGRVVIVEGEAGIGKSRLVAEALDGAGSGLRILRARGSQLEQEYAYGAAISLLEPIVRDAEMEGLAGPAGAAAPLFGLSDGAARPGDPFAVIHALYWLVLNAAERCPIVLAVDDAQWVDADSLRFLTYLARRVQELPISLLLTIRTSDHASDPALARLVATDGAEVVEPAPLSEEAVGVAMRHVLGDDDSRRRRAMWTATGGNPFYLSEVLRARRHGALGPSGVPATVARVVDARLVQLDPGSAAVAEAVAILDESATLRRVETLTGIGGEEVVRTVRELVKAAIFDPGPALRFVHPIVRQAVYEGIPGAARARAHRLAGLLLRDDGAPPGAMGAQLLEAERTGDDEVVEALLAAAADAAASGATRTAVRLLRRALDEPPGEPRLPVVLAALGRAEGLLAAPEAPDRFEAALARIGQPVQRAELLLELGHVLIGLTNWPAATGAFERGLSELGISVGDDDRPDLDPTVRGLVERLETGFVSSAWVSVERQPDAARILDRYLDAGRTDAIHRELMAWAAFQKSTVVAAPADELAATALDVLSQAPMETLVREGQLVEVAAGVLVATDEHEAEIDLLTRAIAVAEGAGLFGKAGLYAYCRSWPMLFTGRLADAAADAQASIRTAEFGWETFEPAARAVLATALIERGDLDGAAAALDVDTSPWLQRVDYQLLIPVAKARLDLALGRPEQALAGFDAAADAPAGQFVRTLAMATWRFWKVVSLVQLGRRDEARPLAAETLEVAREAGARWTLGVAQRVAGIAEGGSVGIELLRASEASLSSTSARLEHARTLVALGRALRQGGRTAEARSVLQHGAELANAMGAGLLLGEARDELRAAGSRPRRYARTGLAALTPSELRVARLAAEGRTNREIAQALFVTPKAVEYHLANAYPKLGIASRGDLAAAMNAS